jgi:hypothetical protein
MIEFNQIQKTIPFNDANLSTALNDFDLAVSKKLLFVVDKMNIVNSIYYKSNDNKLTILPSINSAGTTRLTTDAIALLDELIKAISKLRKARLKDDVLEDVNELLSEKHGNIKVVNKYFSKLELFGASAVSLIADVEVTNKEIRSEQKNGRVTIDKIPDKKVIDGTTSFVPTDASNEEVKLSTSIIYNITLLRTKENTVSSRVIKPYSNDMNVAAMHHLDLNSIIDNSKASTTCNEFLAERIPAEHIECFKAFVWSAYNAENVSRQVVYVYDPDGNSGKSRFFDAIFKPLRDIGAVESAGKTFTGDFGMESCYNARVLIIPDNKNKLILRSQLIHQLTGGDEILINSKNVRQFSFTPHLSIWVPSNILPTIDVSAAHERTRIALFHFRPSDKVKKEIYVTDENGNIKVDANGFASSKGDSTFSDKLVADVPFFLAECKKAYEKLCPTNADINTFSISDNLTLLMDADDSIIEINNFCEKYIIVQANAKYTDCLTPSELKQLVEAAKANKELTVAKFGDIKDHITKINLVGAWCKKSNGKRYIPNIVPK